MARPNGIGERHLAYSTPIRPLGTRRNVHQAQRPLGPFVPTRKYRQVAAFASAIPFLQVRSLWISS